MVVPKLTKTNHSRWPVVEVTYGLNAKCDTSIMVTEEKRKRDLKKMDDNVSNCGDTFVVILALVVS